MIIKVFVIGIALFLTACDRPNSKPIYGDTGLPKNCRAIIATNIHTYHEIANKLRHFDNLTAGDNSYETLQQTKEYYQQQLTEIQGIMDSIDRNCGADGYSWEFD